MSDEGAPHAHFRQARAAAVASRQWGNITVAQLRAIGFSKGEIRGMVDRGWLHRMHRGVYAFGARSPAPEARWAAALLAAGEGSALSHTTAAAVFGQLPVREVTEVTAPTQRRGDKRLRVHEREGIEVTGHRGLRVTTPAQTLLDLAAAGWPIERMTHDLAAASVVSLDDLRTFARNRRGEPGATRLNKTLDLPHTRSDWERRFLRWIQTLEDIPQPILNDPSSTPTTPTAAPWKKRDDAERVWRVRRETWDRRRLAAGLRERLDPHVRTGAQSS